MSLCLAAETRATRRVVCGQGYMRRPEHHARAASDYYVGRS